MRTDSRLNPRLRTAKRLSHNLGAAAPPLVEVLSPRELAGRLSVSKDKVLAWIHAGELQAIDVRSAHSARPQYRIPSEAVRAFIDSRTHHGRPAQAKAERPGRRGSRAAPKINYF